MPNDLTLQGLSAGLRRQVQGVKRQVTDIAGKFGVVRESIKMLAPRVIGIYNAIKAENAAYTFVDFARLFDATIPTHAADRDGAMGYRNHKVYYTLQYMQRQVTLRPRGARGVRDSATDALARTIATMLQLPGVDANAVWAAVQTEFNFGERVMTRLRRRVESTQPLFQLQVPRAGQVRMGNVIHMEPRVEAAAEPAAAPAAGRRRRVAA